MNELYIGLLLLALISNSVLIYILLSRGNKVVAIVSFIIVLMLLSIWTLSVILMNILGPTGILFTLLGKTASFGYIVLPAAFLIFAFSFVRHNSALQKFFFWVLLLTPTFFFLFSSWTSNLISYHDYKYAKLFPWGYETPVGPLFPHLLVWFESLMILALIFLIFKHRKEQELLRKKQIMFVIIATLIPLVLGTITNGILPIFGIFLFPTAIPLTSIMSILIVVAIFRYGLFEIPSFSILSSIDEAIITVDNRGNILQMNMFAETILGIHAIQAVGKRIESILELEDKYGKPVPIMQRVLDVVIKKGKKVLKDTYTLVDERMERFPIACTVSPVFSGRSIIGATLIFRDITKERAREQHQEDFVGIVSHELKTPITSIKAYNQLLLRQINEKNEEKATQSIMKVNEQLDKLTRLISNFLDYSRIESRRLKLKKEKVDVNALVQDVVSMLELTAIQNSIVIKGNVHHRIEIDRDRIEQVLINLLTNALKYSPPEKEILLNLKDGKDSIVFSVTDSGPGISKAHQKKIFDRFYQAPGSKRKAGLGLGLYISAVIIKQHGGKFWLESKKGKGSTFYFSLPRR